MKTIKNALIKVGGFLKRCLIGILTALVESHALAKEQEYQHAIRSPYWLGKIKREAMKKYPYKSETEINAWMESEIRRTKK